VSWLHSKPTTLRGIRGFSEKIACNLRAIELIWHGDSKHMRNIEPMSSSPVAIIPVHSPLIETLALSILAGAVETDGAAPLPVVVVDSAGTLPPNVSSSFVFLGWRGDLEESRRLAGRALAKLARMAPAARHVALFEASPRGPSSVPTALPVESIPVTHSDLRVRMPPEPFVMDLGPRGYFTGFPELDRARRWGAEMYSLWRSTLPPATGDRRESPASVASRSLPWCGAME
jgi:hypothetical protein